MPNKLTIPIIGIHNSALSQKFGVPRQPNLVNIPSYIEMQDPYNTPDAFFGIEKFSHLWITWHFHQNKQQDNFRPQVRPPRLGGNDKLGVFATRSMYRPSNLGLSVVQLDRIEYHNNQIILHILGADFIDQTPIIDIKPYIFYSDSIIKANSGFAQDKPLTKPVKISKVAHRSIDHLLDSQLLDINDIDYICQLISYDPRPAYRQKELGTEFIMRYSNLDIHFVTEELDGQHLFVITQLTLLKK